MATRTSPRISGGFAQMNRELSIYSSLGAMWTIRLLLAINPKGRRLRSTLCEETGEFLEVKDSFLDNEDEPIVPFSHREAKKILRKRLAELEAKSASFQQTTLWVNINWLADKLGFDESERKFLAYAVLRRCISRFGDSLEFIADNYTMNWLIGAFTSMLAVPVAKASSILSGESALSQSGLVYRGKLEFPAITNIVSISSDLCDALITKHQSVDALLESFFCKASPGQLAASDFSHLSGELDLLCAYIVEARRKKECGVNILLYGKPGVGKSEFARLLAKRTGQYLYEVACANKKGGTIQGLARFTSFTLSQKLLAKSKDCLVLFDEIEDVFPVDNYFLDLSSSDDERQPSSPNKAWVNRVLETNPVPAIWISNSVEQIDPAYLRRFDYALEFPAPPKDVRRRIAGKYLPKATSDFIDRLADWENLTPAQIEKAAKVARISATSPKMAEAVVEKTLRSSAKLLGQPAHAIRSTSATGYDPAYLNTSIEVAPLIKGLKARPRGTFCLYGPPGTGKTAFSRHLAERIGKPLLLRRASDLISKWVGESEQNIAQMFQDAQQQDAVLVLDEADSFLADRRGAQNIWEVTQVNELLTQMEDFAGIFICTTNLLDRLDPASLRRFAFKIRFDWLKREQRRQIFSAELKRLVPDTSAISEGVVARLDHLDKLTPGDFAVVARQWMLLGECPGAEALVAGLEEECRVKGNGGRSIGFMA